MFRSYAYWVLFLSSYAPLFGLLALRNWGSWRAFSVLLGLMILSVTFLCIFLKAARDLNPEAHQIIAVKNRSSEALIYIASYMIPFVLLDINNWRDVLALIALFWLVGSIYIRSNLVYINPTLNLFRYGMYEIQNSAGQELILISRRRPINGLIRAHMFGNDVLLGE